MFTWSHNKQIKSTERINCLDNPHDVCYAATHPELEAGRHVWCRVWTGGATCGVPPRRPPRVREFPRQTPQPAARATAHRRVCSHKNCGKVAVQAPVDGMDLLNSTNATKIFNKCLLHKVGLSIIFCWQLFKSRLGLELTSLSSELNRESVKKVYGKMSRILKNHERW